MTSPLPKRWPTFLVIGAYKAGTTTLHRVLRSHPDVFVAAQKEPNFFAFVDAPDPSNPAYHRAVLDVAAYTELFAAAGAARAVGEVSPEYLVNPAAPAAIAQRVPTVHLLAVLRDPVERAWSDWLMYVRAGRERRDFATALAMQEERRRVGDPTGYYLTTGEYADQIARFAALFPRDQLHVWLYDELDRDYERVVSEMFAAIGVAADAANAPPRDNVGGVPRSARDRVLLSTRERLRPVLRRMPLARVRRRLSTQLDERLVRPAIEPELRATLVERFRPDVVRLEKLIDRDLSAWMRVP